MPLTRPGAAAPPTTVVGGAVLDRRPLMGDPPPEVPRHPNKNDKRPWVRSPQDRDPAPETTVGPNGYTVLADASDRARGRYYTRASSLWNADDEYNLTLWKMWVCTVGAAYNRSVQIDAKACPDDQPGDSEARRKEIRQQRRGITDRAFEAGGGNDAARAGTAIHAMCDEVDRGRDVPPDDIWDGALSAYRQVISRFEVRAIETFVVNDAWCAAGTFDRLVSPRWPMTAPDGSTVSPTDRLVWDLKTSQTSDFFGCKFAVQLAVYANGLPYSHEVGRMGWALGEPRTDWGLILHLPSGGSSAELWWVDLQYAVDMSAWGGLVTNLGELACLIRKTRNAKLFYPAELPAEGTPAGLDELGFARLLRDAPSAARVEDLVRQHKPDLSDAQLAAARARWAELSTNGGGAA